VEAGNVLLAGKPPALAGVAEVEFDELDGVDVAGAECVGEVGGAWAIISADGAGNFSRSAFQNRIRAASMGAKPGADGVRCSIWSRQGTRAKAA
jgi:hypothetical protein